MNKLKPNYTCTDPDCAQYMAKVTDTRYSYIEYREWFGNYIVCHAVVDLQDYTLDEICTYCWTKFAHTAPHTMILWNRWLPTTVFVERCRLWQNVFLNSLASMIWSLMQNKKVKARQLNSYTNG